MLHGGGGVKWVGYMVAEATMPRSGGCGVYPTRRKVANMDSQTRSRKCQ